MRWMNEDRWTGLIEAAAARHGVPVPLVQAIIATESQFNPAAYRPEPKIGDGSAGLMQILLATARGTGYTGPLGMGSALSGLFDPATNIEAGTAYLAEQYGKAGDDPAAAASAYNGGWRPEIGFGALATRTMTICLARDSKTGQCIQTRTVQPGEFSNQLYVNAVLANLAYFQTKRAASTGVTQFVKPTTETGAVNWKFIGLLVGLLVGLIGLRMRSGR